MVVEANAVMKEEVTLIWVAKEMPLNVSGDGECGIETLTLFTCLVRLGEHWWGDGVSGTEVTSVKGTGIRFVKQWRGREFLFFLFLSRVRTADEGLESRRRG